MAEARVCGKPHRGSSGHCYHSPRERVAQAEALKSKGMGRTSRLGQTGVEWLLEGGGQQRQSMEDWMHRSLGTYERETEEDPEWAIGSLVEKKTFRLLDDHGSVQRMESIQRTQPMEVRSRKVHERFNQKLCPLTGHFP